MELLKIWVSFRFIASVLNIFPCCEY